MAGELFGSVRFRLASGSAESDALLGITRLAPLLSSSRSSVARRLGGLFTDDDFQRRTALATQGMNIAAQLFNLRILGNGEEDRRTLARCARR